MNRRASVIHYAIMILCRGALAIAALAAFAPAAHASDSPKTIPTATCPYVITAPGNYVLNSDMQCNDSSAIIVASDNVTIQLRGYSIRCWDAAGFKRSCQGGDITAPLGPPNKADYGIDTGGKSNVQIKGPGMIQGFDVGVYMRGFPSGLENIGSSATNVKVQKVNVTGPDGRSDISEPLAGPRPATFGILAALFVEKSSTCSKWDSEDGHTHGVDIFGNSVDNHTLGIALYASSRVDVHENFVHDNNDAGDDATTALVGPSVTTLGTPVNNFESHGIVVCANDAVSPAGRAPLCDKGVAIRNKIQNNLVVDNGQNACTDCETNSSNPPGPQDEATRNIDGGVTLVGLAFRNDVKNNTVMGNNGDGISVRNGADDNRIYSNTSLMNTSTDATLTGYPATNDPYAPGNHFWDIAFRGAGLNNSVKTSNRCLTQTADAPLVCFPGDNDWWK